MKEIFNYYRSHRLANPSNLKFKRSFLTIFILMLIMSFQLRDGVSFDFSLLLVFSATMMAIFISSLQSDINFSSLHPIKSERKQVHHIFYIIFGIVFFYVAIILLMLILMLIFYIFDPSSISAGEEINSIRAPFYYHAWLISYAGFMIFIFKIRNVKKWWITYLTGTSIYVLLNVLMLSTLNSKFTLIGNLVQLFEQPNNALMINYIIGSILLISFVCFIYLSIRLSKPKKQINYR